MRMVLLGSITAIMALAAVGPAYAEDDGFTASIQDAIDSMTDLRNDYLVERFFGESYPTPRVAAVETVNSAIDLYESTRADPRVQVADRGTFVKHPTNPYGTAVVAFDVINSMSTDMEVYPFVIDVGTLKILAEGAFPVTVGLSAFFLNDADRPLEEILEALQESDGVWVTYTFANHNAGGSDDKRVWLSLHDGYIFGAGYYEVRGDDSLDRVDSMVRMYDADGVDSFAAISAGSDVSFVLDAGTLEIVAHSNPNVTGSAISDAMGITWHLRSLSEILAEHESLSVSYPSADPQLGSEYTRAHLRLHDGYVFGSGYGMTEEQRIQSVTNEAIQLYELEGEDAFRLITLMEGVRQIVLDPDDNTILAFTGFPNLVGLNLGIDFFDQDQEAVLESLEESPGLWTDSIFVNPLAPTTQEMRSTSWVVLHDGYLFTTANVYSPEEAAVDAVNAAIDLYKTHGEGAFDRITWQAAVPEIVYPFVNDAESWELIAHGGVPERVGVCCAAPIAAAIDLDDARQALEQNPGIWVEYSYYNPVSERYEYKRTWLSTYDGYTFGAGYYYGNFEPMERVIQEVIDVYEAEGRDAAFEDVNAMRAASSDYPFILDRETLEIVAHGQDPSLVGTNLEDKALGAFLPVGKIKEELHNDGDTTFAYYSILDLTTGSIPTKTVLFQLHDGYVIAAGQPFVVYTR